MEAMEELEGENESIDESYEECLRANAVRDEELIKFVEDFMNSEEFYLAQIKAEENENNECIKDEINCICTECWKAAEEKPDLVKNAQQIWAIEHRFEKFLKNKIAKEIVKHQGESIKVIREKIAEAKSRYSCHKEERELLEEECKQKTLEDLSKLYGVNTNFLSTKSKVVHKVLVYNKIRHVQRLERKERMCGIFRKILNEYSRQRQIDELRNRRYDTKVVRKEKILKDVEVVGTQIQLLPRYEPKVEVEEIVEEKEWEEIVEPVEEKPKKGKQEEKDKKKDKDSKKDKMGKEKDTKKDKKGKGKADQEEVDLVLPYVPAINERYKIKPKEDQKMMNLIKEFEIVEEVEKEREKFEAEKKLGQGVFYPVDSTFSCYPKVVVFQGFKNGVTYRRKIRILNGGKVEKKCRFYLVSLDVFDPSLIQIEPVGVQKAIPGMHFDVTVTFSPETLEKSIRGSIIFLTYQSNKNLYTQICVSVFCIPWCSHVISIPDAVTFETLPIWKAKKICEYENYKTIKIFNTGLKPCKITIHKIEDPFQLDEVPSDSDANKDIENETGKLDEITFIKEKQTQELNNTTENEQYELYVPVEESDIVVGQIIDKCVDYVFNAFTFDCYCFNMDGKSERKIRIYFRNVDYVGSYYEKYLISVFEEFEGTVLECVGSKVSEK